MLKNQARALEVLLDAGASPNDKNNAGRTCLHLAAAESSFELVMLLLSRGADALLTDAESQCPFDLAADTKCAEALRQAEEQVCGAEDRLESVALTVALTRRLGCPGSDTAHLSRIGGSGCARLRYSATALLFTPDHFHGNACCDRTSG